MVAEPENLSTKVKKIVEQEENELILSAASGWEIAMLWKRDRVTLPADPSIFVPQTMHTFSVKPLAIECGHCCCDPSPYTPESL